VLCVEYVFIVMIIIITNDHVISGASSRVVTHWSESPLTPAARVQLPDKALSRLTQATIHLVSVKCVATSKQWVTAVEDCLYRLLPGGSALAGLQFCGCRSV